MIPNSSFRAVSETTPRGWCLTFPVEVVLGENPTEADKLNAKKENEKLCDSGIKNWEDCVVGTAFIAPVTTVPGVTKPDVSFDSGAGSVTKADEVKK